MRFFRQFLLALIAAALLAQGAGMALAQPEEYDINAPQNLEAGHLYAQSALLVDEDSGEVLFSKNSKVRMYPASTTKIMTLLLALESGIPLDSQVTIPPEAAQIADGSSVIPVKPGDVVSFSDLLYGFMLSSGNDGANAIAVLVDGSIEPFVERMNRRAAELGCEGTHYVNAHGYHDADHYTTAQDLAVIAREAMKNEEFRRIVATPRWEMTVQRGGDTVIQEIISRNSLLQRGEKYYYPDCTGIKTGHHNKAGWCFVGSAQRDGKRLICVVLNCEEEMSKWYDAARLFEYGFTRYAPVSLRQLLLSSAGAYASIQLENADPGDPEGGRLALNLDELQGGDQTIQVVAGSEAAMKAAADRVSARVQVQWDRALVAPVSQGERMGSLTLALDGMGLVTAALTAARSVAEPPRLTATPTAQSISAVQTLEPESEGTTPARRSGFPVIALVLLALAVGCGAVIAVSARNARRRRARARRRRQAARSRTPQRYGPSRPPRGRRPAPVGQRSGANRPRQGKSRPVR